MTLIPIKRIWAQSRQKTLQIIVAQAIVIMLICISFSGHTLLHFEILVHNVFFLISLSLSNQRTFHFNKSLTWDFHNKISQVRLHARSLHPFWVPFCVIKWTDDHMTPTILIEPTLRHNTLALNTILPVVDLPHSFESQRPQPPQQQCSCLLPGPSKMPLVLYPQILSLPCDAACIDISPTLHVIFGFNSSFDVGWIKILTWKRRQTIWLSN